MIPCLLIHLEDTSIENGRMMPVSVCIWVLHNLQLNNFPCEQADIIEKN